MTRVYRKSIFIATVFFLFSINSAFADLNSDAERILNWAEPTYPELFPTSESTQFIDGWRYRYYPQTDIYVGINDAREVAVLGDIFNGLLIVGTVEELLTQLPSDNTGENEQVNTGNGNCTPVNYPDEGTVVDYNLSMNFISSNMSITTLFASSSSLSTITEIVSSVSGFEMTSTTDSLFLYETIDDYTYQTSVDITATTSIPGANSTQSVSSNTTYSPSLMLSPASQWCEEQSWVRAAVNQTVTTTDSISGTNSYTAPQPATTNTVNSISEIIIVPAGTFTTVKAISVIDSNPDMTGITWVDVNTGNIIKQETWDESNTLISEMSATSIH